MLQRLELSDHDQINQQNAQQQHLHQVLHGCHDVLVAAVKFNAAAAWQLQIFQLLFRIFRYKADIVVAVHLSGNINVAFLIYTLDGTECFRVYNLGNFAEFYSLFGAALLFYGKLIIPNLIRCHRGSFLFLDDHIVIVAVIGNVGCSCFHIQCFADLLVNLRYS